MLQPAVPVAFMLVHEPDANRAHIAFMNMPGRGRLRPSQGAERGQVANQPSSRQHDP